MIGKPSSPVRREATRKRASSRWHLAAWPTQPSWMNGFGKIRRCTDRNAAIIDFYLYLAAAIVTIRQLIQRARTLYRWDTRPTTRRLR